MSASSGPNDHQHACSIDVVSEDVVAAKYLAFRSDPITMRTVDSSHDQPDNPPPDSIRESGVAKTLANAYDVDAYRRNGHQLVDLLADYLDHALTGRLRVHPWREAADAEKLWADDFADPSPDHLLPFFRKLITESAHLHHPGYMGHQVSPPALLACLSELATATLNNSLAVYEVSPAGTAIEAAVVGWLARELGFDDGAGGIITSGGSIGNLTGLLAARQKCYRQDSWEKGTLDGPPPAVLISGECHYSVARAVKVMGWGESAVVRLPTDDLLRIRPEEMSRVYRETVEQGRKVVAVVGNACSTATGTFDPLEAMADFAAEKGLWFHVDAAHGGGAALTEKYAHLVAGLARADSVVVDFHKMFLCPSLCTAVLFKNGETSFDVFAQHATYLLGSKEKQNPYDLALRTLECTKSLLGARVYVLLKVYGKKLFAEYITGAFDLARDFAALIRSSSQFELAVEPQANVVCFRFIDAGKGDDELDAINSRIRRQVNASGRYFLVQTHVRGRVYLRTTLMNPFTTVAELEKLLNDLFRLISDFSNT